MPKVPDALEELEAAYTAHQRMEKSRKKMDKGGSDNPPADPDNMGQYDNEKEEDEDNKEEMNAQYGDTEPQDGADKKATREAAKRQKEAYNETRKSRREKDEEDELDKCRECGSEVDKSQKFCHNCGEKLKKSKGSTTRTIRDSQDAYLRDGDTNDDDLHGEREEMGKEEGKGDDDTIITNMGRRTKPKVEKSRRANFYDDLVKSGVANEGLIDANPALEDMIDIFGDHLAKSEAQTSTLAKSNREVSAMLAKSMQAQAALLRTVTNLQQQVDNLAAMPSDQPFVGVPNFNAENVVPMQKSNAATKQQTTKLSKSLVRERLIKGMREDMVQGTFVADFDNWMAKGLTADQWVENALTDDVRQALGL